MVTQERKADLEAILAELEFEIALAIKQGEIDVPKFNWMASFDGPDKESWIAVLTIAKVE